MAVTTVTSGLNQTKGVPYTVITDSSADWVSVANDTYFYDIADGLPHYKDSSGTVLEIFGGGGLTTTTLSGPTILNTTYDVVLCGGGTSYTVTLPAAISKYVFWSVNDILIVVRVSFT